MDKIQKLLSRLTDKQRRQIEEKLGDIARGKLEGMDIKKLAGRQDIYRVRKGVFRILLLKTKAGWNVISIERRSDTTYK